MTVNLPGLCSSLLSIFGTKKIIKLKHTLIILENRNKKSHTMESFK